MPNVLAGYDARNLAIGESSQADFVPDDSFTIRGLRIGVPEVFFFDRLGPEEEST